MPRRRRVIFLVSLAATLALTSLSLADSTTPRAFAPTQSGFTSRGQNVLPYAPDRLLVQFEAESVDISSLGLAREKGAAVPRAETKLASIDDLARQRPLRREADDVVCLEDYENFGAIGFFYADFRKVSDEEVIAQLAAHPIKAEPR